MREILFRGRTSRGEWGCGSYLKTNCHWIGQRGVHDDWIVERSFQQGGWLTVQKKYAVDPETVGQYTGLTDKNGKKIFEGDILASDSLGCPCAVAFVDNEYWDAFCAIEGGSKNGSCYSLDEFSTGCGYLSCKVIGNIYDNPELLEVTKE